MIDNLDSYPRILNGDGCLYGRHLMERVIEMEKRLDCFESKLNKILWALVAAAIGFGSSAVFLGMNLALR